MATLCSVSASLMSKDLRFLRLRLLKRCILRTPHFFVFYNYLLLLVLLLLLLLLLFCIFVIICCYFIISFVSNNLYSSVIIVINCYQLIFLSLFFTSQSSSLWRICGTIPLLYATSINFIQTKVKLKSALFIVFRGFQQFRTFKMFLFRTSADDFSIQYTHQALIPTRLPYSEYSTKHPPTVTVAFN